MNGKKAKALRRKARKQISDAKERNEMLGTTDFLASMPEKVIYEAIKRLSKRGVHASTN